MGFLKFLGFYINYGQNEANVSFGQLSTDISILYRQDDKGSFQLFSNIQSPVLAPGNQLSKIMKEESQILVNFIQFNLIQLYFVLIVS